MKSGTARGMGILILAAGLVGTSVPGSAQDVPGAVEEVPVVEVPEADLTAEELPGEESPEALSIEGSLTADQLTEGAPAAVVPPIPEGGVNIVAPASFSQAPWGTSMVLGPVTHPTPANHQVQQGEDLHQLAAYYYGNSRLWRIIFEANREQIQDPNIIPVGVILLIPVPEAK